MRSFQGRLLLVAALLMSTGCVSTAEREDIALKARQANSHLEIGIDHMTNDRVASAVRELRVAASLDPKNPRIQAALAEAYIRKGHVEEGEKHLIRAIEIFPEYHDARLNLSGLYLMIGRYAEAATQSQILIEDPTFPGVWRAYTNRALAEIGLGNDAVAREQLEYAIEYHRDYWPALLSLGILETNSGRKREAIGYFEMVLNQKPDPNARAETNYRLAEIYVSLGQRGKAVAHLKTALANMPDGEWGRKSKSYLKILQ
jgi:Tfp pilus assembly protein PilF